MAKNPYDSKDVYYQERNYGNDVNGNPRKAVFIYEKTGNNIFLSDVETYNYETASQIINKKYEGKKKSIYKIDNPIDSENYSDVKRAEKMFKQERKK
jgi:hypothetical protein